MPYIFYVYKEGGKRERGPERGGGDDLISWGG